MNTHDRDRLDDSIDQVAAHMTAVREDDAMAERIVAALPEASLFQWWLRSAWAPRLAAVALVLIGAALWNRNGIERPNPARPSIDPALVAFAPVVVPNRPITRPLEHLEPLEPLEPVVDSIDFERSLPALDAMTALSFESLSPRELPASRDITPAPIEIGDLALTSESFFPRD